LSCSLPGAFAGQMNRTKDLTGACTQCGAPISFPADRFGTVAQCPHCGQETELRLATPPPEPVVPRKVVVWTVVAVLVLLLGLAGSLYALNRAKHWAEQRKAKAGEMEKR
jgi:uncharacterized paraquat-inducible protein A